MIVEDSIMMYVSLYVLYWVDTPGYMSFGVLSFEF